MDNNWQDIVPEVNGSAEFFEIVNDFGNPLEIIREAISNAIDWDASKIIISFEVGEIDGSKRLIIKLTDNGVGMTKAVLSKTFWGLGYSESREQKKLNAKEAIGEKGHGTKIYLRSEKVIVNTRSSEGSYESYCEYPLKSLTQQKLHTPRLREIESTLASTGTQITVIGYNDNERSKFIQEIVKDYILWFTKAGSIELNFDRMKHKDFKVYLKCLDAPDFEEIKFGHPFPKENYDIDKLFAEKEFEAADHYVKHFIYKSERLKHHPEVTFDAIISIEGDEIKWQYNPMIREKRRSDTGRYKVSDRYGIWICKDYIPITKANEWVSGFGTGSNSLTLVHGFVNCQALKLTANRGTVANTDPQIIEELKQRIQEIFDEIDSFLQEKGIYTLRSWQQETRTLKQETAEFNHRVKSIKNRRIATVNNRVLLEPANEAELFGFFTNIYTIFPEKFDFEPLDYNTSRGIDIIARNKTNNLVSDSEFWYIELKFIFKRNFNHAFRHLSWIICWDFDKTISNGSEFYGIEESDTRTLDQQIDDDGHPIYFLDNKRNRVRKIEIIRLKEFIKNKLGIEFEISKTVK